MSKKDRNKELYQGECCDELYDEINEDSNIDGNYNSNKEQYISSYWNYISEGGDYDE